MARVDGTTVGAESLKIAATSAALDKVMVRVDDFLVGAVMRVLTLSVGAGMDLFGNSFLVFCLCGGGCLDGFFGRRSSVTQDPGTKVAPELVSKVVTVSDCPLLASELKTSLIPCFLLLLGVVGIISLLDFDCKLAGFRFFAGTFFCFLRS